MGRPLKIKISNTQDAGFNNPGPLIGMATTPTGELFYGVVGGNISTSDYDFPVTTTRIFPAGGSITTEGDGYILRQKGASKYLVSRVDSTAIDPADAVVGQVIRIVTVGNTDWSAMMGDSNQGTIAIGLIFTVVAASAAGSTGTATECGICTLANKADASLASGEMTITYTAADSSAVRIKRMSNKQCIDFSDPPVVSLTNFFNILDDTVKIGGSGSAASPATRDLVQVENASL
jgi:hypothetical protein